MKAPEISADFARAALTTAVVGISVRLALLPVALRWTDAYLDNLIWPVAFVCRLANSILNGSFLLPGMPTLLTPRTKAYRLMLYTIITLYDARLNPKTANTR